MGTSSHNSEEVLSPRELKERAREIIASECESKMEAAYLAGIHETSLYQALSDKHDPTYRINAIRKVLCTLGYEIEPAYRIRRPQRPKLHAE